ncbi:MAG: hypothetical protein DRJ64_04310 [Thermoprotei archaeon]|nr:MAG: hypothetical protein DRJ64_04310 [Thermoprotei archaeon]
MTEEIKNKLEAGDIPVAQGIEIYDVIKEVFMSLKPENQKFFYRGDKGFTWYGDGEKVSIDKLADYLWEAVEEEMAKETKLFYVYVGKDNAEIAIETLEPNEKQMFTKESLEVPGWELYIGWD